MAAEQTGQAGRPPQGLAASVPLGAALSWRGTVVGLLLHSVAPMAFVPPAGLCAEIAVGRQSPADQLVSGEASTKR